MKHSILALALASLIAAPAIAADEHAGHDMHGMSASAMPLSEGVVKKIDTAKATVTLAHGPLKNLGMGAMTMTFAVDKAVLAKLKVGDKVRFLAEEKNDVLSASHFEAAK